MASFETLTHSFSRHIFMMIFHSIPFIHGCKIQPLGIHFPHNYTFAVQTAGPMMSLHEVFIIVYFQ